MAKEKKERGMFASLFGAVAAAAQSIEGAALAVKTSTLAANQLAWSGVAEANKVFAESLDLSDEQLQSEQDLVLALRGKDMNKLYELDVIIPPAPAPATPT
jgi:hypothetical protein